MITHSVIISVKVAVKQKPCLTGENIWELVVRSDNRSSGEIWSRPGDLFSLTTIIASQISATSGQLQEVDGFSMRILHSHSARSDS